jgi:hypothetical protein
MDTEQKVINLERKVAELEKRLNDLNQAGSLPFEVTSSFERRGFVAGSKLEIPLSFAIAGMGMIREVGISGDPQTISVLEYPHTFLKIRNPSFLPADEDSAFGSAFVYIPIYVT